MHHIFQNINCADVASASCKNVSGLLGIESLKQHLGPSAEPNEEHQGQAPVLLLHGFDSSSLEFRRLLPLLEKKLETWAVDLVGWGFSDSGAATRTDMRLGPQQKRDHLYAFWKEKVMLPRSLP